MVEVRLCIGLYYIKYIKNGQNIRKLENDKVWIIPIVINKLIIFNEKLNNMPK